MNRWVQGVSTSLFLFVAGCSSAQQVKKQDYADYKSSRTFEYPFATTWTAIEEALRGWKIVDRDPDEANEVELKQLTRRSLETDWFITQSKSRYHEFKVNDFPRKIYLQERVRYEITARSVLGGTEVEVETTEEVEVLGKDGKPVRYDRLSEADSARAKDLLDRIYRTILSLAP